MEDTCLTIGLASGKVLLISEVFLCLEEPLRRSNALRLKAAEGLKGFTTGLGFWGSPEWAIGGAGTGAGTGVRVDFFSRNRRDRGRIRVGNGVRDIFYIPIWAAPCTVELTAMG